MKRALLVGAGGMGRAWAKVLSGHPGVGLVGWVDAIPGRAAEAVAELQPLTTDTTECFVDVIEGINATDPDLVVNVTSPEAHRAVTLAALRSGRPVLSEKPLAASMEEARELLQASEDAGRLLMVSQNRRYEAGILAFRGCLGPLGELGQLHSDFFIGAHFGGFRDLMESPLLLDMSIHTFDAARYVTGLDPVSVYCDEFNPPGSWYRGAACANAIFEMEGGLRYTYRGSWCAEGLPTAWTAAWRAVGRQGSAVWDGEASIVVETVAGDSGFLRPTLRQEVSPEGLPAADIEGSLAEFLDALETGATPMGECHDNIKSLAMVCGAIESAARGERVAISA